MGILPDGLISQNLRIRQIIPKILTAKVIKKNKSVIQAEHLTKYQNIINKWRFNI